MTEQELLDLKTNLEFLDETLTGYITETAQLEKHKSTQSYLEQLKNSFAEFNVCCDCG